MGDLLRLAGVARAVLRVAGRHRTATWISLGIAVVVFVVGLGSRAHADTGGVVVDGSAVVDAGAIWGAVALVVWLACGALAGAFVARRRYLRRGTGDAVLRGGDTGSGVVLRARRRHVRVLPRRAVRPVVRGVKEGRQHL